MENHKAKERLFESFKLANFPGKHLDAGADQGFLERGFKCLKDVGFALWILSHFHRIFNSGRGGANHLNSPGFANVIRSKSPIKD